MVKYITYGITKEDFSKERFHKNFRGTLPCKPLYGLWASRADAKYGWKDWCADSGFKKCNDSNKMEFTLTENTKILEVHCEEDILPYIIYPYPWLNGCPARTYTDIMDRINFDKLKNEGYSGLELFISDDYFRLHTGVFNSWDCDSIVVWNFDAIKVID